MRIRTFEDIQVWIKAKSVAVEIYEIYKNNRDFGFRDQIQRAAVSISNNIAEGFERQGNKEFKKFLFIAKGSSAEVRSMLYISLELGYMDQSKFNVLYEKLTEISKMLSAFIKTL